MTREIPNLADRSSLRIGLISDTHIPEARHELWPQVFDAFAGVDCILHAGDIHDLIVIDQLSDVAPTFAARGNGDDGSGGRPIQPFDDRLREAWLLNLAGLRVGLTHDVPIPEYPPHLTLDRAMNRYFGAHRSRRADLRRHARRSHRPRPGCPLREPRVANVSTQPRHAARHARVPRDQ